MRRSLRIADVVPLYCGLRGIDTDNARLLGSGTRRRYLSIRLTAIIAATAMSERALRDVFHY